MTGYTVHTGSNDKFSAGWDNIFNKAKPAAKPKAALAKTPAKAAKKATKARKAGK